MGNLSDRLESILHQIQKEDQARELVNHGIDPDPSKLATPNRWAIVYPSDPKFDGNKPYSWNIANAIHFVRQLEDVLNVVGLHVGITGGTLFRGFSQKDLDIIVYPHDTTRCPTRKETFGYLEAAGLVKRYEVQDVVFDSGSKGPTRDDKKDIVIWEFKSQRVDIFLLGFPPNW